MDSYQAIYDAVRSRISNCDIGRAVADVARDAFDVSRQRDIIYQELSLAAWEMKRPSVLYRPSVAPDGNMWCALYGENLAVGVAGFGETPDAAMRDFDKVWAEGRTPTAMRLAAESAQRQPQADEGAKRPSEPQ